MLTEINAIRTETKDEIGKNDAKVNKRIDNIIERMIEIESLIHCSPRTHS